ncbi:hypothetical protein BACCOP_04277 [Phocaeicola coprocola DSM 17136]|uniref:Uncharacterized protein n=1 Tax=Phocaeicola coprocola DSM 17136 TaxID=470145 RepID=B3JQP3_9BACT|nr:hypothetical protein BACCOP_04277 [Phocaeicola coprocola DSM 17136]
MILKKMTCRKQLFGFWHVILFFRHLSLKSSEKHQHLFLKTSASFFIFSAIFHPFFCIFLNVHSLVCRLVYNPNL